MLARLRDRGAVQAIVLVAMAATLFGPPGFAFYRCRMMGATLSSPCCAQCEDHSSGQGQQLQPERCCIRVSGAIERAPSDLIPRGDEQTLGLLGAEPAAGRVAL